VLDLHRPLALREHHRREAEEAHTRQQQCETVHGRSPHGIQQGWAARLRRQGCFAPHREGCVMGNIKTKTWDAPREADDGFRLLICRYRPRALPKKKETWDLWWSQLGPSKELHAAFYGKHGQTPINWETYKKRYLKEMKAQDESITILAEKVAA